MPSSRQPLLARAAPPFSTCWGKWRVHIGYKSVQSSEYYGCRETVCKCHVGRCGTKLSCSKIAWLQAPGPYQSNNPSSVLLTNAGLGIGLGA